MCLNKWNPVSIVHIDKISKGMASSCALMMNKVHISTQVFSNQTEKNTDLTAGEFFISQYDNQGFFL